MKLMFKTAMLALGVSTLAAAPAQAELMTFSGVTSLSSAVTQASYTEDGITATSVSGTFWGFPTGGQLHLDLPGFGNDAYDFTMAGPFSLLGFNIVCCSTSASALLAAYDASNSLITSSTIGMGANGPVTFSNWTGISRLRLSTVSGHFSIDNLSLSSTSAVPEPASWAMMLAGFGVIGFAMRRRPAVKVSFA